MKQFLILTACAICISVFFCSCEKEYTYMPYDKNGDDIRKDAMPIKASSDTAAYNAALNIHLYHLSKAYADPEYPFYCGFRLMKSDNKYALVGSDNFPLEYNIYKKFFGDEAPRVDESKKKELLQYFDVIENADKDITWYRHRACDFYNEDYSNQFIFYLYFGVSKRGTILPLHLTIKYKGVLSDGKTSIKKITYTVDGKKIEYLPEPFEYNKDNRSLESDEQITYSSRKLLNAMLTAQNVSVVLTPSGAKWVETKLSDTQILNIKRTIALYKAMGGFYVTKDNF
ncbi:MAG: hypothetical protein II939_01565 [Bacteroidales bacterium]|nr:hypothetical protein [Bacteroidales bacterium]